MTYRPMLLVRASNGLRSLLSPSASNPYRTASPSATANVLSTGASRRSEHHMVEILRQLR